MPTSGTGTKKFSYLGLINNVLGIGKKLYEYRVFSILHLFSRFYDYNFS